MMPNLQKLLSQKINQTATPNFSYIMCSYEHQHNQYLTMN